LQNSPSGSITRGYQLHNFNQQVLGNCFSEGNHGKCYGSINHVAKIVHQTYNVTPLIFFKER